MIELGSASAAAIAQAVKAGELAAAQVVDAALSAIRFRDPVLNAFTAVLDARAMARAEAIERDRANNKPLGPLAGVPFAVKNLFDVQGLPTLAGARINRERAPAGRDAPLIEHRDGRRCSGRNAQYGRIRLRLHRRECS